MCLPIFNINTASPSELEALPGIGPAKTKAIADYRQQHGAWVKQDYLPEKIKDQRYFTPEDTGKYERALAQRKETIDKLRDL